MLPRSHRGHDLGQTNRHFVCQLRVSSGTYVEMCYNVLSNMATVRHGVVPVRKRSRLESLLTRLSKRKRYVMVVIPRGHPQANSVLTYREYKDLPTEQRLAAVQQAIVDLDFIKESRVSGFFSAVSGCLSTAYSAYLGDTEVFAWRCYPLICAHLFVPPDRLSEQVQHSRFLSKAKLDFTSALGEIDYNIRANWLYGSARILGRKKYLEFCFMPLLSEIFKGLEYLARLHSICLDNRRARDRFKNFIRPWNSMITRPLASVPRTWTS